MEQVTSGTTWNVTKGNAQGNPREGQQVFISRERLEREDIHSLHFRLKDSTVIPHLSRDLTRPVNAT